MGDALKLLFSPGEWTLNKFFKNAKEVEVQSTHFAALKNGQLLEQYQQLQEERAKGTKIDKLAVNALGLILEVAYRQIQLKAYPVQLVGAQVMAAGNIAEMKTGEGKTLVAAFTAALWALDKKGVRVVTANEYLAKRDAELLRPVYEALGLTVGVIYSGQPKDEKKAVYGCDIIYGTSSEFGFDYLRANMVLNKEDQIFRPQYYAIVDEVDSLLIDEARTPLIIAGNDNDQQVKLYEVCQKIAIQLIRQVEEDDEGDYWVDEKNRQIHLSEQGQGKAENLFIHFGLLNDKNSLYLPENLDLLHHLDVALRANALMVKDVHYVVQNDQIMLIDPFTGRVQPGRQWSNGLHQAVEVKEGLKVNPENETLASIAIQHYFGQYRRLAGMTGTAKTEAKEFQEIYGLKVVEIPTHRPIQRHDSPDVICVNKRDKLRRIVREVEAIHQEGRPILIGTPSVSASEELAILLREKSLSFSMLNAKNHAEEAHIIARAGEKGSITLATSMAGRGTDILLGGSLEHELKLLGNAATTQQIANAKSSWQARHEEVVKLGGLHVIGTERQESRRVDNQLRGRAGRQGDPGSSRFYLSLEDDLLRIFASPAVKSLLAMLGLSEGATIENERITKQIENAQKQMEALNYNSRKSLLDYDSVTHDQRLFVYAERQALLDKKVLSNQEAWEQIVALSFQGWSEGTTTQEDVHEWSKAWNVPHDATLENRESFSQWLSRWDDIESYNQKQYQASQYLEIGFSRINLNEEVSGELNAHLLIQSLDYEWRQHIDRLALIRQGIHLRGYAQKQPIQEYKKDAHASFMFALEQARLNAARRWMGIKGPWERELVSASPSDIVPPVSRNAPCPCGSGKRYKECHGSLSVEQNLSEFVLRKT